MQQYPTAQLPPNQPPQPSYGQPQEATQQYVQIQQQPHIQNQGCCSGYSQNYNVRAGISTGIVQLILGFITILVNALSFVFGQLGYPGEGQPIGIAILLIIPAGIIGITTKSRWNCVIIAYLVMSILSTINGFVGVINEGLAAGLYSCFGAFCFGYTFGIAIILHSFCAVLLFIESIVAIVAAAYCCRGLLCCRGCCCCGGDDVTLTTPATTVVYPQHTVMPVQPNTVVVQTANPV